MQLIENFRRIKAQIPDDVTIVAAVKTRTAAEIKQIIAAGITHIGHNYVQEAEALDQALGESARQVKWHMIGNLQKNKINKALKLFDVIQTIDSEKSAAQVNERAQKTGKMLEVFIEINIGNEQAKAGMIPEQANIEALAKTISKMNHLKLCGLMTMGPLFAEAEELRPHFKSVKQIYDHIKDLKIDNTDLKYLSMGMSDSYQIAIEEGSNMIRLGTILFGPRSYH